MSLPSLRSIVLSNDGDQTKRPIEIAQRSGHRPSEKAVPLSAEIHSIAQRSATSAGSKLFNEEKLKTLKGARAASSLSYGNVVSKELSPGGAVNEIREHLIHMLAVKDMLITRICQYFPQLSESDLLELLKTVWTTADRSPSLCVYIYAYECLCPCDDPMLDSSQGHPKRFHVLGCCVWKSVATKEGVLSRSKHPPSSLQVIPRLLPRLFPRARC